eukprot:TRINITY_DN141334_c0_g1_i1.p1 TRINITY_DN141334_c0_g1~~TRINITY_DN141334_c0_g1_i1.p1  ORF type:complete len:115 (-),score=11.45 TRINITY_DN141334_c0_g1_i1:103-447(-)
MTAVIDSALYVDCSKKIGTDRFAFFEPVDVGPFTVQIWKRQGQSEPLHSKFALNIYENGNLVLPKRDKRFSEFSWVSRIDEQSGESLNSVDVQQALYDISRVAGVRRRGSYGRA